MGAARGFVRGATFLRQRFPKASSGLTAAVLAAATMVFLSALSGLTALQPR